MMLPAQLKPTKKGREEREEREEGKESGRGRVGGGEKEGGGERGTVTHAVSHMNRHYSSRSWEDYQFL
ncbi:hypothetical protein LEMLEM_LOCUS16691 [Lemmus lemmus]